MRKAIYDTNKPVKYCTIPEESERYRLSRFLLLKILGETDAIFLLNWKGGWEHGTDFSCREN